MRNVNKFTKALAATVIAVGLVAGTTVSAQAIPTGDSGRIFKACGTSRIAPYGANSTYGGVQNTKELRFYMYSSSTAITPMATKVVTAKSYTWASNITGSKYYRVTGDSLNGYAASCY